MSTQASCERAPTGRAKCRGCGAAIARGEVRVGEALPNPFANSEMMIWFHPVCAAYRRPELLLALEDTDAEIDDRESLRRLAAHTLSNPRLTRLGGAECSPSGQARCRQCHDRIARGDWRIRLSFHRDGQFAAGGFVHVGCRETYFGTPVIALEHVLQLSPRLSPDERADLTRAWRASGALGQ